MDRERVPAQIRRSAADNRAALPYTISLLHATYRAGDAALEVKRRWLDEADEPSLVEHVFSLDEDDEVSVHATDGHERIVNPSMSGGVTAVRNWNAAAAHARGDVLVVIADDLFPPPSWDRTLRDIVGALDPARFAFAVKVGDGAPGRDARPTLMRHPVVSRCFYARLGLFDGRFRGLLCDDDFTVGAFRDAVVLGGSRLVLEHRHPSVDAARRGDTALEPARESRSLTDSQRKIGTADELRFGVEQFRAKWTVSRRAIVQAFFTPPPGVPVPRVRAWRWRVRLRLQALLRRGLGRARSLRNRVRSVAQPERAAPSTSDHGTRR